MSKSIHFKSAFSSEMSFEFFVREKLYKQRLFFFLLNALIPKTMRKRLDLVRKEPSCTRLYHLVLTFLAVLK